MPIQVTCKCGKQFQTKDENAGRRAHCPECGTDRIIPNPAGEGVADVTDNPYLAPATGPDAAAGVAPRTSGKAMASLVLGISSFLCSIFTAVPAIILGILGLGDIKHSRGAIQGKGMAITGIVLGSVFGTIGGIAILIALLLPAVQMAREAARRAHCVNNLKQIALAMHGYESAHHVLPPAMTLDPAGQPLLSWRVLLLPYLDQVQLYEQFKLDEPWNGPHNRPLLAKMPKVYECPSWPQNAPDITIYHVLIGPDTVFENAEGVAINEITDGTSNTLMVLETKAPIPWTRPSGLALIPKKPIAGLGSAHPGGFNAVFVDGSVKFIKDSTLPETLESLATRNAAQPNGGSY